MIKVKLIVDISEEEVKAVYGKCSQELAETAVIDILDRYANQQYFDPELHVERCEADPDNDEFECEVCGGIFDIDDSISIAKGTLVCEGCHEEEPTPAEAKLKQVEEWAEAQISEILNDTYCSEGQTSVDPDKIEHIPEPYQLGRLYAMAETVFEVTGHPPIAGYLIACITGLDTEDNP